MNLEKFEYEQINTIMNEIDQIANEVRSVLTKSQNEMNENIGNISTWSGDAANSVKSKWDQCADNFDTFIKELHNMVEKMSTAHGAFKAFEDSAK